MSDRVPEGNVPEGNVPEGNVPEGNSLTAALAAFQAALPAVAKKNTATVNSPKGSYTYAYADLEDISAVILPLLGKHGLAWSTAPTIDEAGHFVLVYQLAHVSGDVLVGTYPLPDPSSGAQVLGSAITYARRYALCAVTGVSPGGDDDGAASSPQEKPGGSPAGRSRRSPASASPKAVEDAGTTFWMRRHWEEAIVGIDGVDADYLLKAAQGFARKAGLEPPRDLDSVAPPSLAHRLRMWLEEIREKQA